MVWFHVIVFIEYETTNRCFIVTFLGLSFQSIGVTNFVQLLLARIVKVAYFCLEIVFRCLNYVV